MCFDVLLLLRLSAHVGCTLLSFGLNGSFWFSRQLNNRSLLPLMQKCQEHDSAVRKLQRIVMGGDLFFVDLAKDCSLVADHSIPPT
jgi:hypothetical protein